MMTRRGGERVKGGFYWNLRSWTLTTVPKGGAVLPGERDRGYVKVPALLLLVLAPVMGGIYVGFLPFIGFAMVFGAIGAKLLDVTRKGAAAARETAVKRGL
jgi:hypothetical protein